MDGEPIDGEEMGDSDSGDDEGPGRIKLDDATAAPAAARSSSTALDEQARQKMRDVELQLLKFRDALEGASASSSAAAAAATAAGSGEAHVEAQVAERRYAALHCTTQHCARCALRTADGVCRCALAACSRDSGLSSWWCHCLLLV